MTMIRTRRLLRLARFLDTLTPRAFDFSIVAARRRYDSECGSICCGIGWTPVLWPREVEWAWDGPGSTRGWVSHKRTGNESFVSVAQDLFNLSYEDAYALFAPLEVRPWVPADDDEFLGDDATPQELAESIRAFVRWHNAGRAKR